MSGSGGSEPTGQVSCVVCGTDGDLDDLQVMLGWSMSSNGDERRATCPPCTRAHVRSIEGKLPEEWW